MVQQQTMMMKMTMPWHHFQMAPIMKLFIQYRFVAVRKCRASIQEITEADTRSV